MTGIKEVVKGLDPISFLSQFRLRIYPALRLVLDQVSHKEIPLPNMFTYRIADISILADFYFSL